MSLKMFDYMAAKMIIIASNLKVYNHILKNNFNCKLVDINDDSFNGLKLLIMFLKY